MIKAIDILCNLFTPDSMEKNWVKQKELSRLVKWWHLEDRMKGHTPEEFVKIMDEAGVDKVLIPAIKMRSYKYYNEMVWNISNEEVYEVVKKFPDRFVGIAGFNPLDRMDGIREVERAIKEYGFKGVYIHTYGYGIPINDRLYYPLYAKCVELGVPVSMQIGHSAEHMPSSLGRPILLDDIALDFPELNIIGAHVGWPWSEEMIALAWKHENVYMGIDAHAPQYLEQSVINFMNTRGQSKVMYGTNWPAVLHKQSVEYIKTKTGLKEKVVNKILRDNAARVYKL
jgi:hypothetical protein